MYLDTNTCLWLFIVRQTRNLFVYFERNTWIDLCILIQICTVIYLFWGKHEWILCIYLRIICVFWEKHVHLFVIFQRQASVLICVFSEHGGWSGWSSWTECSVTCGEGEQLRSRTCTAPAPAHGGHDCIGDSIGKRACQLHKCGGKWMFVEKG